MLKGMHDMTVRELREQGYSVTLFTPEELGGAPATDVGDRLVELGLDVIADLKPNVSG